MKAMSLAQGSVCSITALLVSLVAGAQTQPEQLKQLRAVNPPEEVRTFFLANVTETQVAEEILNDMRILLPHARAYYVPSQDALTVQATAEDMTIAEKTISELDRKRKVYRITYSIAETDGGKPTGTQHVELVIPTGSKTVVKQGSRVPIVIGGVDKESGTPRTQVQYVDVGLNIEASLEGSGDALRLQTKVEQSGIGDEKSGIGAQDPVIRQTQLEGWSMLIPGKPTLLGSLDIPGTMRHEEISVVSEPVR